MGESTGRPRFAERFLHVDMDAFFVEVERLRDSSLIGVPVVVGGLGARGVVASASYEARAHGVRSAMPMGEARRRCPHARLVPPDHRRYGAVSREVFAVLESFTPFLEELSVDEAFLDVSGLRLHYAAPEQAGTAIRHELAGRLGLPASVGIATTKFLAKLASEEAKPDGLIVVPAGHELEFLHPLPVRRLWGVGQATHAALEQMAIVSVGDLAAVSTAALRTRLGPSLASHLSALAHGHDPRGVEGRAAAKSISVEETYSTDLRCSGEVERALLELSTRLSGRLHRSGYAGRTMTLKLRFSDFTTLTRSLTREVPFEQATDLWDVATVLLNRMPRSESGVRLLGLGVAHLEPAAAPRQLSITEDRRSEASRVAEEVRARFGADAVLPARLAGDADAE